MLINRNISNLYNSLGIKHGLISINFSLDGYPRITVTEYGNNLQIENQGKSIIYGDHVYLLEDSQVKTLPLYLRQNNFADEKISTYTHIVKRSLESPLEIKKSITSSNLIKKTGKYSYVSPSSVLPSNINISTSGKYRIERIEEEEGNRLNPLDKVERTTARDIVEPLLKLSKQVMTYTSKGCSSKRLGAYTLSVVPLATVDPKIGNVPTYKDTKLSWEEEEPLQDEAIENTNKKIIRKDGLVYYTYEGDWNPHERPPTDSIPRDLSIMFDNGGITKSFTITRYRYDKPEYRIEGTFGYAHAAIELIADPLAVNEDQESLLSNFAGSNPEQAANALYDVVSNLAAERLGFQEINFANNVQWRLIKVKQTDFNYENVPFDITDPYIQNEDGTITKVHIPEEYIPVIEQSNLQALVSEDTKGWELRRFTPESSTEFNQNSVGAWINLQAKKQLRNTNTGNTALSSQAVNFAIYQAKLKLEGFLFRKIPLSEKVVYNIAAYGRYYKDARKINWQVTEIPKNQISEFKDSNDTTLVQVLTPDLNWAPDLMIRSITRFGSSLATMGNPDWNPLASNYYEANPTTISSGSEELEFTAYGILPSEQTDSTINELFNNQTSIGGLLTKASSDQSKEGTIFKPHVNLAIADYGLPGSTPEDISFGFSPVYPNSSSSLVEKYQEFKTLKTSSGVGVKNNKTTNTYTESEGRPPTASVRKPFTFEEQELNNSEDNTPPFDDSYTLITSNIQNSFGLTTLDYSAAMARNEKEAKQAAIFDLEMAQISNSSLTIELDSIEYISLINPNTPGNRVVIQGVPDYNWIIKDISFDIQIANGDTYIQPIQITCGCYEPVSLSSDYFKRNRSSVKKTSGISDNSTASGLQLNVIMGTIGSSSLKPPNNNSKWVN